MRLLRAIAWAVTFAVGCTVLYLGYLCGLATERLAERLQ